MVKKIDEMMVLLLVEEMVNLMEKMKETCLDR